MIVASRAAYGEAEPHRANRRGPIDHLLHAILFAIHAAFAIGQRIAMEAGRDLLLERCIRQQISGDLLGGELVKRHPSIYRADHPVAPLPRIGPEVIFLETIAIGIARQIQPMPRPLLAIVR